MNFNDTPEGFFFFNDKYLSCMKNDYKSPYDFNFHLFGTLMNNRLTKHVTESSKVAFIIKFTIFFTNKE